MGPGFAGPPDLDDKAAVQAREHYASDNAVEKRPNQPDETAIRTDRVTAVEHSDGRPFASPLSNAIAHHAREKGPSRYMSARVYANALRSSFMGMRLSEPTTDGLDPPRGVLLSSPKRCVRTAFRQLTLSM